MEGRYFLIPVSFMDETELHGFYIGGLSISQCLLAVFNLHGQKINRIQDSVIVNLR